MASFTLKVVSATSRDTVNLNRVYTNPATIPAGQTECFLSIGEFVFTAEGSAEFAEGTVALNAVQRKCARVIPGDNVSAAYFKAPDSHFALNQLTIEIDTFNKAKPGDQVDGEQLIQSIQRFHQNQVFSLGQQWMLEYPGLGHLILKCNDVETIVEEAIISSSGAGPSSSVAASSGTKAVRGQLVKATAIVLIRPPNSALKLTNIQKRSSNALFRPNFNFEELGIGGLDSEFSDIFRRAFASRIFPPAIVQKLGINHVKGILLFGPPGTGKTLMARQIGKMLNCKEPKIVNGPEILNKFVGQSEENVRKLFEDAEKEQAERGDDSDLHLIIFDELDAVCKQRGSTRDGTGVHDTVVNQLLSKIDGVNALHNVLIIGMTNRKDMIDEALLRPGRFEVQVEISLPDETGRHQILRIHTKKLDSAGALGHDVDISSLASSTKNFSGAELEGLVKSAASFAFQRQVDPKKLGKAVDASKLSVGMEDFKSALVEVKPAYGVSTDQFEVYLRNGLFDYGEGFRRLFKTCQSFVHQIKHSERTHLLSVLLDGPPGSGKTALAARIAVDSGCPYVKVISPENMVGYSEFAKAAQIAKVFDDAYKSPLSVVVLDNIERLVEYIHIGPRFSNTILQTVSVLLNKIPPKGRKLLVIGTSSNPEALAALDVAANFNVTVPVPLLSHREDIRAVLNEAKCVDPAHVDRCIDALPGPIGIKKLLQVIEMARSENPTVDSDRFSDCLQSCGLKL